MRLFPLFVVQVFSHFHHIEAYEQQDWHSGTRNVFNGCAGFAKYDENCKTRAWTPVFLGLYVIIVRTVPPLSIARYILLPSAH